MNRVEVLKIMAVLRAAYPQYYRNISDEDAANVVNLWTDLFAEDDASFVGAAVKAIIVADNREFPPLVGTIKEKMRQLTTPNELTEGEAWAIIAKAVKNSLYASREEFDALPPMLKKLVRSPSQLKDWAMMDSETLHSVVASNVQKAFRTIAKREQEAEKLPASVKIALKQVVGEKLLGDGSEK